MQFTGKVLQKTEKIKIGQKLTPKQSLILEEVGDGKYKDSIMIDFVGDDKVNLLLDIDKNDVVGVEFNTRASEYNGRWYSNNNAWKITSIDKSQEKPKLASDTDPDDDLPW